MTEKNDVKPFQVVSVRGTKLILARDFLGELARSKEAFVDFLAVGYRADVGLFDNLVTGP